MQRIRYSVPSQVLISYMESRILLSLGADHVTSPYPASRGNQNVGPEPGYLLRGQVFSVDRAIRTQGVPPKFRGYVLISEMILIRGVCIHFRTKSKIPKTFLAHGLVEISPKFPNEFLEVTAVLGSHSGGIAVLSLEVIYALGKRIGSSTAIPNIFQLISAQLDFVPSIVGLQLPSCILCQLLLHFLEMLEVFVVRPRIFQPVVSGSSLHRIEDNILRSRQKEHRLREIVVRGFRHSLNILW